MRQFQIPIAILTFSRPASLRVLLASLFNQTGWSIDPNKVFFFQDGAINPLSNEKKCRLDTPSRNRSEIERFIPSPHFFESADNLGIALNFRRAESYIFNELGSPYGIFLEDDLELFDGYLSIMEHYIGLMQRYPDIVYGTAFGDNEGLEPQSKAAFISGTQLWGFIMPRSHWLKQCERLTPYFDIIGRSDYYYRDSLAVLEWYQTLGIARNVTSQDAARVYITTQMGAVRLNTRLAYSKIQPVTGTHMTEEALSLYKTPAHGRVEDIPLLSIDRNDIEEILRDQQQLLKQPGNAPPGAVMPRPIRWDRKVLTRENLAWGYRILLGREPDAEGAAAHLAAKHSLREFVDIALSSEEFKTRRDPLSKEGIQNNSELR